jgi:hypothetical protein
MRIHGRTPWVIKSNAVGAKESHVLFRRLSISNNRIRQLPHSRPLHPMAKTDQPEVPVHEISLGPRAVQPNHLVVAHKDHKQIRIESRAFAGNWQNDVRIHSAQSSVIDLDAPIRELLPQHGLQNPAKAKGRVRSSQGCGFAQDEHSVGTRRFLGTQQEGRSPRRLTVRVKPVKELLVRTVTCASFRADQEIG